MKLNFNIIKNAGTYKIITSKLINLKRQYRVSKCIQHVILLIVD